MNLFMQFHLWDNPCFMIGGIQYVIKHIDNLDKVRTKIKENHGIEFEEVTSNYYHGWWSFANITDDRDIHLIVERVDIID